MGSPFPPSSSYLETKLLSDTPTDFRHRNQLMTAWQVRGRHLALQYQTLHRQWMVGRKPRQSRSPPGLRPSCTTWYDNRSGLLDAEPHTPLRQPCLFLHRQGKAESRSQAVRNRGITG